MSLTLGYKASAGQFGARELVELAVQAERHGFESVAVSDHFQPWRHTGGHAPLALAWMAAAGERTSTIRLGTSVITPTFRYNPAVLAQAFATLGSLLPGRVWMGVGTGEALNELAAGFQGPGAPTWPDSRERFARLREAIRLMRALWTGQRVSFDGEYYSSIYDLPESPVPLYVAASGPTVARYAGRVGDGFIDVRRDHVPSAQVNKPCAGKDWAKVWPTLAFRSFLPFAAADSVEGTERIATAQTDHDGGTRDGP